MSLAHLVVPIREKVLKEKQSKKPCVDGDRQRDSGAERKNFQRPNVEQFDQQNTYSSIGL